MIRRTTFRQLEIFDAIARHGSFTKAADELYLTQPTVSVQVKKLSDAVGLPLFEQVGKSIYLTEAGRQVHAITHTIQEAFDQLEMQIADLKGMKRGTLQLAVLTTAQYFIPRMLGPFCNQYPGIEFALEVANRQQMLERLKQNLDDLYIFGHPPEAVEVTALPFLQNPLVPLASKHHPLAHEQRIPLARFAEEPFLLREQGSGTRRAIERVFQQAGLSPKVRLELGSNEAIQQAIAGGLGVSILSQHTLALKSDMELAVLDVEDLPIQRSWYLVYPKGKQLSLVAKTFLEYLLNRAPSLAGSPLSSGSFSHP